MIEMTSGGGDMLSESQRMIRDMARDFATTELAPNAAEWEALGTVPRETRAEMGALGLMGVVVPEEWGGAGADFTSYALALEEIAQGDAATSLYMSLNNSPCGLALLKYGEEYHKET
jgi:hypothetical protein